MNLFDEIRFFTTALEKAINAGTPTDVWLKRLQNLYDEGQMAKKTLDVMTAISKEFKMKPVPKRVTPTAGGCGSIISSSCAVSTPPKPTPKPKTESPNYTSDPCGRGNRMLRGGC